MEQIVRAALNELEAQRPVVWSTILEGAGSTPRSAGARMLVKSDGTTVGTVGGGLIEAYAEKEATKALGEGSSRIARYRLTNEEAAGIGMVCGGEATLLFEYILPSDQNIRKIALLLEGVERNGRLLKVTTIVGEEGEVKTSLAVLRKSASHADTMPPSVIERGARASDPFVVREGERRYLVDPTATGMTLYLLGAGHVAFFTARIATMTGFHVIVVDDREEFANRERYPAAADVRVIESFDDCFSGDRPGQDSFVVIVTRGHTEDKNVLAQSLRSNASYIGMIGSRKKREATYRRLREEGFTDADLDRVHSPIGLSTGAETPEEIAVSIASELILERSKLRR